MAELGRVPKGRPPPVHLWEPDKSLRDRSVVLRRMAIGYHEGALIERPRLVRLLAGVLRRIGDDYFLVTPAEACQITVEDAPFLAVSLASKGEGQDQQLSIITNVGDEIEIGAEHPLTFRGRAEVPRSLMLKCATACSQNSTGLVTTIAWRVLVEAEGAGS